MTHDEAMQQVMNARVCISDVMRYIEEIADDEMPDSDAYPRAEQLYISGSAYKGLSVAMNALPSVLPRRAEEAVK